MTANQLGPSVGRLVHYLSSTFLHPVGEPLLPLRDGGLGECHVDGVVVLVGVVVEEDAVPPHVGEVLLRLFACRGTQTFVVPERGQEMVLNPVSVFVPFSLQAW